MTEAEYVCPSCGFTTWEPIAKLGVSSLALYDDARYPGRCLLVLREHHEVFEELSADLASQFVADAQRAARAIRQAVSAERMNYALLGNVQPHLHFHLIPRTASDPAPGQSPWNTDLPPTPLSRETRDQVIAAITAELAKDLESLDGPRNS